MADLITLAETKLHLNVTSNTNDTELGVFITAASSVVEEMVGPVINQTVTDVFYAQPSRQRVLLSKTPVVSVTSLATASYGTAVNSYVTAALQVNAVTGELGVLDGTSVSGDVTVVYVAGRGADVTAVPKAIKLGTLELIRHMWSSQRGAITSRPGLPGDEDLGVPGAGFLVPNRVRELLTPWLRAPAVA